MRMREMMASTAVWLAEGIPSGVHRPGCDESIRRALLAELRSRGLFKPLRCDVRVQGGIVQIAGVGTSAQEKIATRAAAESIPGVRGLRDGRPYWVPEGGYE